MNSSDETPQQEVDRLSAELAANHAKLMKRNSVQPPADASVETHERVVCRKCGRQRMTPYDTINSYCKSDNDSYCEWVDAPHDRESEPELKAVQPPAREELKPQRMDFESRMGELARLICRRPRNVYAGDWQFVKDLLISRADSFREPAAETQRQFLEHLGTRHMQICDMARQLIEKLRLVHDDERYNGVWFSAQLHQGSYDGPTYTEELAALESALASSAPAQPDDDAIYDEVQRRVDAVVDAAVEWHQDEGDAWSQKAEVLADSIEALLELRSEPGTEG